MLKKSEIKLPTNKKFGLFFSFLFTLISIYFFYEDSNSVAYLFAVVAGVFILVSVVKADLLMPLNLLWMSFGLMCSKIVNPIILGVLFFGLFTPLALIMRIVGRDELRLKFKKKSSYWKIRDGNVVSSRQFENQF